MPTCRSQRWDAALSPSSSPSSPSSPSLSSISRSSDGARQELWQWACHQADHDGDRHRRCARCGPLQYPAVLLRYSAELLRNSAELLRNSCGTLAVLLRYSCSTLRGAVSAASHTGSSTHSARALCSLYSPLPPCSPPATPAAETSGVLRCERSPPSVANCATPAAAPLLEQLLQVETSCRLRSPLQSPLQPEPKVDAPSPKPQPPTEISPTGAVRSSGLQQR